MHYEENYMTYVEDDGCCDAVIFRLRKKRHFIVITLLLVLAIVSILAGLFNGFTLKKYSDLALTVGIVFPSIILVFICVYLAFICGRESFRSSMRSRIHHLSGRSHSHPSRDVQPYSQTDSEIRNNPQVRNQSKAGIESIDYLLEARNEKMTRGEKGYNADELVDYCEAKISRKHVRSFSNSDISKRKHDGYLKKSEMCGFNTGMADDAEHSPRFRGYQDVGRRKFKRSISDTVNRSGISKSKDDKCVWNTESLEKVRKNVVKVNSFDDEAGRSDFESNVARKSQSFHQQPNSESAEKYEKSSRFKEYVGFDQRYKSKQQEYVSGGHEKGIKKENYTKSEIRLYSSGVLKAPYEYKQTLRFSSFQPGRNAVKDTTDNMVSCSSGDEKSSTFSRSDCDTLEMERKIKRLENFPSERDTHHLRRKTIYCPSTSNKESTRPSREYAHEYCKYTKKEDKKTRRSFPKNDEKFEDQNDKQVRFHR